MTDEAKRIVNALREHTEWARANEWEAPITLGDDLEVAASMIEKLYANWERAERLRMELFDICSKATAKLEADRDTWKRLAEAAERDITSMLESCDCEARHEYCARCFPPKECNTDECAGHAEWRGPCAENGGVDDGNQADHV